MNSYINRDLEFLDNIQMRSQRSRSAYSKKVSAIDTFSMKDNNVHKDNSIDMSIEEEKKLAEDELASQTSTARDVSMVLNHSLGSK